MTRVRLQLLTGIALGLIGVVGASAQTETVPSASEQISQYLLQAGIVKTEEASGVALRVTLTDGTVTRQAWFQTIDASYEGVPRETYHFNLAAYAIADLIGVAGIVPPVVERILAGQPGSLALWSDDIAMTEAERRQSNASSPDPAAWTADIYRMRVLAALVYDAGRDPATMLITKAWKPVLLDFTRAFVPLEGLPPDVSLLRCDKAVLDRLKALTRQDLDKAVGDHLTPKEREAVMKRRDQLVKHFKSLVGKRGEEAVIY